MIKLVVKRGRDDQRPAALENADQPPAFPAPPHRSGNRGDFNVQRRVGLCLRLAADGQQPPGGDGHRHPQPREQRVFY